jgi:hypothetical protein
VDVTATLDAPCGADELFSWVDDLNRYAQWLSIIANVTADGDDTWMVDLRGRVGPFARSKRLRMRRTEFRRDEAAVRNVTNDAW